MAPEVSALAVIPSESPPVALPAAHINWIDLTRLAKEIFSSLGSLNPQMIGTGLVLYDKEKGVWVPRSYWFNNAWVQSLATWRDKRATFEYCLSAFYYDHLKCKTIYETVRDYIPDQESAKKAADFALLIASFKKVINEVTKFGLEKLCENYKNRNKLPQAAGLRALGEESIKKLEKSEKILEKKLNPLVPNLAVDLELTRYMLQAQPLLEHRVNNLKHLKSVSWTREKGLTIPKELIRDCLRDLSVQGCTKAVLKCAACLLKIPSEAQPIPTLEGRAEWRPMCLKSGSDDFSVYLDKGVTGTCDRAGLNSDNLANFYSRWDPFTQYLTLSCGAVDTPRKAAQLAFAMNTLMKELPNQDGRWVLFQLNSFFKEEKLVHGAHRNVALNEPFFRSVLNSPTLSFLHVNTCFNATTMFSNEDPKSVKNVNIDALARMGEWICNDLAEILNPDDSKVAIDDSLKEQIQAAAKLASTIMETKKKIQAAEGGDQFEKVTASMIVAKEEREKAKPETPSKKLNIQEDEGEEEYKIEFDFLEQAPKDLKELKAVLDQQQKELEEKLKKVSGVIARAVSGLEEQTKKVDPYLGLERALLILKVYDRILKLQLKIPSSPSLSRSTEVELFLLLYRLLNITPVIICYSGLDRSGAVRALEDTQLQMIKIFYDELLEKVSEKTRRNKQLCKIEAIKKLFNLILNLDAYRLELFDISYKMKPQPKYLPDLSLWEKAEPNSQMRGNLFKAIETKYSKSTDTKKEELFYAQFYLEQVVRQLLATESIKTYYSSGVIGLKYLLETTGPKSYFANFHVVNRWPEFAFTEDGRVMKIVNYSVGYLYTTINSAPPANALVPRIAKLRPS